MSARLRNSTALPRLAAKCGLDRLRRFAREEDGVLAKPFIFFFLSMLAVGGIGVDLMRMERDRTVLQYTLDRAVLAAADLDQPYAPAVVVQEYLQKAGLGDYYQAPWVESGLGYKKVEATIDTTFNAHLLKFAGGGDMPLYAKSRAEESIGNVEISLVLDISGSMNSNYRLTNLKTAAHSFINQITENTENNELSVSIIPYATQVNAGEALLSKYNISTEHDYSWCVNFIADQFSKTTISRTEQLWRTMHFDPFTYYEGDEIPQPVCPTRDGSEIVPLSNSPAVLHDAIDRLQAGGNTSIDIGMKWGGALLDPSARSVVNDLVDEGEIAAVLRNRPYDYGTDTLKIIVLMSDGENTDQYMLNESMRTTLSDIWYNSEARAAATSYAETWRAYSAYHSNGNAKPYYWPYENGWFDHPYGNAASYQKCSNSSCTQIAEIGGPAGAVQMYYKDLLARVSLASIARHIQEYSNSAWAEWYNSAMTKRNRVAKDQFTKNICDRTKDKGVMIFAIGFEAPRNGTKVLKDCASSPAHFFDVEGLEIEDAFSSIATSIRQLRLTQ